MRPVIYLGWGLLILAGFVRLVEGGHVLAPLTELVGGIILFYLATDSDTYQDEPAKPANKAIDAQINHDDPLE